MARPKGTKRVAVCLSLPKALAARLRRSARMSGKSISRIAERWMEEGAPPSPTVETWGDRINKSESEPEQ